MSLYNFVRKTLNLGVGTLDLGLVRPQTLPMGGIYDPRRNVRRSFAMQSPGYMKLGQTVVPISLVGNGLYLQGQLVNQQLAKMSKGDGQ